MYMFIIFERNYHRKLLQKTGCNYLLPFWNCDIFFTAIKIRILKICRKMVAIRSWISRKLSHEGIFFYAYLERACRNWPNNEFSWKNHSRWVLRLCPAFESWLYIYNQQLLSNGLLHDKLVRLLLVCLPFCNDIFLGDYIHKYQLGMINEHCPN
jgi:hypothetical protein